ncbi:MULTISPECIES: hypothetical protein [unclassified Streptomyces]|uniref:hypothetical protein n=1 Tax=unclassified Streptomyces TaxID=2593676 RepID=UPI0014882E0B|nr:MULTISPECIES: hypothetical protein [unclassified Streptomyces]
MSNCIICTRTAPDGSRACQLHADELRAWLTELPRQAALLEAFVAPSARPTAGRIGGTGRAHAPIPADLRVLTLLGPGRYDPTGPDDDGTAPITATLGAWAGHIAYHYPAATRDPHGTAHTTPCEQAWPTRGETITGWCNWLLAYLPFTLTLPLVDDFHEQLGNLIRRIRDLTHATPHRHAMAAPCPQCEALALVTVDGQWDIRCEACGHHLEREAYDEHANAVLARLAERQQAP